MSYSDLPKPILMFDMDGTLLDLAFDDFIWNYCLPERYAQVHQCSFEQSQQMLSQFYSKYKHTLDWYSSTQWTAKVDIDILKLQYEHRDKICVRTGCFELLQQLKTQGYRCWLLTNADLAGLQLKLEKINLRPYFELMISSEEIGHAKEEVAFWQKLQQRHPFDPTHSVFIDDTETVLDSAAAFGISQLFCISQPASNRPARAKADLGYPALDHLTQLYSYLQTQPQDKNVKTA